MTTGTTPETEVATPEHPADDALLEVVQKSARRPGDRREWGIPAALAIIMLAQLWSSVVQLSITSDEIDHLHAGYRYLQCNDFGWNPEHPPLVKMIAAAPLMAMSIKDPIPRPCGLRNSKNYDFVVGHEFIFANPERMLTAARWAVSSLTILLLLTVWFFARKMFGLPVAIISGVLVAFDPNFLANGALVTTDSAAALGFVLAVYALYCYVTAPNSARLLALGFATGFALCLKHSTVLLAVILPMLVAGDAILSGREGLNRRLLRYAGALSIVAVIAFSVLWAGYGFRYAARPAGAAVWIPPKLPIAHGGMATKVIPALKQGHVLPEAYLVGLQDIVVNSEVGVGSFLLGTFYPKGSWFYFPVAATIKFTLPVLLMLVVSVVSWRYWRSKSRELLFLILPVIVYLTFSMSSHRNIGSRHVLPVLPLLTIFAAAGVWSFARNRRWAMVTLLALLAFHVGSSLHAYPNYLSYSNELWGGPSETYRYLANSDTDWGQAQKMARNYIAKTHPLNCFFLRTYHNLNSDYGIPCGGISEDQWDTVQTPFTGTMIISSTVFDGIGMPFVGAASHRIFKDLTPVTKLGGSALLVYEGTFDLSPLVAVQLVTKSRAVAEQAQDPQLALDLAQQAAQSDPSSGDAHVQICACYHTLGEMEKAEQECNLGLTLIRKDPQYGPWQIEYLKNFIARKGLRVYDSASRAQ